MAPGEPLRLALTLALSAAGGLAAYALGLPAPWIAGGMFAVAVASLAGVNTFVPMALRPPVFLVLGIYAGSGVSPETLNQMRTWPASFAILGLSLVLLIAGSFWWLHRRCGWDRNSALLASLPGALSLVVAAAEGLRADMKKVAISQILRVFLLVELIPLAALFLGEPQRGAGPNEVAPAGLAEVAVLIGAAVLVGYAFERLRLPGGWLLGGLAASGALHLTELVPGQLPAALVVPSTVLLAAVTGSRFRPGDWAMLPTLAGPALVAFVIASGVSAAGALAVTALFGVNIIQTLLAFAPGAIEVLIILAYGMDTDPAYVAAHHVARFVALAAAVPLLGRWLDRKP